MTCLWNYLEHYCLEKLTKISDLLTNVDYALHNSLQPQDISKFIKRIIEHGFVAVDSSIFTLFSNGSNLTPYPKDNLLVNFPPLYFRWVLWGNRRW